MRDDLNSGLPSDRFQVDWWLNTRRVERRLSRRPRPPLALDHYLTAEATLLEAHKNQDFAPRLPDGSISLTGTLHLSSADGRTTGTLLLVEIPFDFQALKAIDLPLARDWRSYTRKVFENAFATGYIVTDFVIDHGRNFYVLTHADSTLQD